MLCHQVRTDALLLSHTRSAAQQQVWSRKTRAAAEACKILLLLPFEFTGFYSCSPCLVMQTPRHNHDITLQMLSNNKWSVVSAVNIYICCLFVDVTPDYVSLPQLDYIRQVRTQSNKHPDKVFVSGGLASITVWRAGHCLIITDDMFRNNRTLALLNRLFGDIEDMHLCHVCMEDVDCLNSCSQCQYTIYNACKMRCSKCPACRTPLPSGLTCSYSDLRLAFPYGLVLSAGDRKIIFEIQIHKDRTKGTRFFC